MFLMPADTLRGQVGGVWSLDIKSFFGPCETASTPIGTLPAGVSQSGIVGRFQVPHTVGRYITGWMGGGGGCGRPAAISVVEEHSVFTSLSLLPCVVYCVIKL